MGGRGGGGRGWSPRAGGAGGGGLGQQKLSYRPPGFITSQPPAKVRNAHLET